MSNRRQFVKHALIGTAALSVLPRCTTSKSLTADFVYDPIDIEVTREFVLYAHSDLTKLSAMVPKYPHLINATVDWGDGDYESAIGASGHVGNVEITNYLISQGARPDIFVMTMLGMTDSVISIFDAYPQLINAIGPHGFTLLHHAKIGKERSQSIYDYLEEKGLSETFITTFKKD